MSSPISFTKHNNRAAVGRPYFDFGPEEIPDLAAYLAVAFSTASLRRDKS